MPCLTGNGPLPRITTHGHTDDVRARRVLVSAFWHYRVSLQRKKCCQQIIRLNDESFPIAVRIDAKKQSVLCKMLGDTVGPACCVQPIRDDLPVLHGFLPQAPRFAAFASISKYLIGCMIELANPVQQGLSRHAAK